METKASEIRNSVVEDIEYILGLANLAVSDPLKTTAFTSRFEDVAKAQDEFREAHSVFNLELKTLNTKESKKLLKDQPEIKRKFNEIVTSIKTIYSELTNKPEEKTVKTDANKHTTDNVRLPKLTIPTFYGKLNEWSHFSDLFVNLVHNNANLSDVEKHEYLKLSLKGEALMLIKHLPVNSASYLSAWKIVDTRYNVPRTIAEYHLKQILALPNCSSRTYNNLNTLVNGLRENIAALKVLGLPVKEWSFLLLTFVKDKLDSHTRSRYEDLIKNFSPQSFP